MTGKKINTPPKSVSEYTGELLLLAVTIYFSIKCISAAMTQAFAFDGAIMAQVAQNLAEKFAFAVNYTYLSAGGITIGLPVSLPAALNFKLAGQGFAQGLLVNAGYMILLFIATIYCLKKCLKLDTYIVLLWSLIFFATPGLFDIGFGLYGEIPMLFFMIAGMIFFQKYEETGKPDNLFYMGLLWGLGFLTKTVFLIVVPGLIFTLLLAMAAKNEAFLPGKRFYKAIAGLAGGFLAPSVIFEMFKFCIYGFGAHLTNWKWYLIGAAAQAGVMKTESRLPDTYGFFNKVNKHLDLLSSFTGIDKTAVIVLLCFMAGMLVSMAIYSLDKKAPKKARNKRPQSAGELLIMAVALTYFIWWIFITPTARAWHRRIFDGIILYGISFTIILRVLIGAVKSYIARYDGAGKRFIPALLPAAIILLFFVTAAGLVTSGNYRISFRNTAEKEGLLAAGKFISSLPPQSQFYGFAWWQAPNVSFAAGKTFRDIFTDKEMLQEGPKNERYFVFDKEALINESICYKKLLSDYEYEMVFSNSEATIYKLNFRNRIKDYDECQ